MCFCEVAPHHLPEADAAVHNHGRHLRGKGHPQAPRQVQTSLGYEQWLPSCKPPDHEGLVHVLDADRLEPEPEADCWKAVYRQEAGALVQSQAALLLP